jgi:rSAM/selenodomain-associated transferase 1
VRRGSFSLAFCATISGTDEPKRRSLREGSLGYFPSEPDGREQMTRSANCDCVLVIMAKAPRVGSAKTRLAQSLPPAAVLELCHCLLDDTIALAKSLDDVDLAIVCPPSDVEDLSRAAGETVRVVAQSGDGLAAGLTSVFGHFTTAGYRRIIAFNSDSPHLPASVLKSAFQTLAQSDVVVGPTHDGGYYLVGAKASHPGLFAGDGLGTTNAFELLMARTRALELSVGFTSPFYDVDVAGDLIQLTAELQLAPARAPRTAGWLKEWAQTVAQLRTSPAEL